MSRINVRPTGRESPLREDEIIVSKTDPKGRITYVNSIFMRVSQFPAKDLLGQPHSIIRHPDMPRSVFKLLWETIAAKGEIFAYILNMAASGDHYWVFAHVTPTLDAQGNIIGYHSNRRKADRAQIAKIEPLYRSLLEEEKRAADRKLGMQKSYDQLQAMVRAKGIAYDEFIFTI
jgi:PAS domain S-box-containing protein